MEDASERRLKVFVSSTFEDLVEHRQRCIEILDKLKNELQIDFVGMESFGANSSSPKDYSLERIAECDLYVGVFGMRYGSIDHDSAKSITELEYRMAQRLKLPCLIYLMDEKRTPIVPSLVDRGYAADRLQDLKKELSSLSGGHVVGMFHSPDHLASQLVVDLVRAVRMLRGATLSGLRKRVDLAIDEGCTFIRDMENFPGGGWSYFRNGVSTCWDTSMSLLALAASETRDCMAAMHRGQRWLIANRNPRSGWQSTWESNPDASTTLDTAIAVLALVESGYRERPLEGTAQYLLAAQHPDGGWPETFGHGAPATAATSWAIRALVAAGFSLSDSWARRALRWLLDQQWNDGGWAAAPWAAGTTIGKTRDALMALSHFGPVETGQSVERAQRWLIEGRRAYSTVEQFGRSVGAEPYGVDPTIENVLLFLEAAFFARLPPSDTLVKNDLEWICTRHWWSYTPRAVTSFCQYRKWLS